MVKVSIDITPTLRIFRESEYAVILIENMQISKFTFDDFAEESRHNDWTISKNVCRPCMCFYKDGTLINVVRNVNIEILFKE